jgi:hypothetical protein
VRHATILRLGEAHRTDFFSVFHWIWQNKPLDIGQYDFIFHVNDMVSATGSTGKNFGFNDFIESYLSRPPQSNLQVFNCALELVKLYISMSTDIIFRNHWRQKLNAGRLIISIFTTIYGIVWLSSPRFL